MAAKMISFHVVVVTGYGNYDGCMRSVMVETTMTLVVLAVR